MRSIIIDVVISIVSTIKRIYNPHNQALYIIPLSDVEKTAQIAAFRTGQGWGTMGGGGGGGVLHPPIRGRAEGGVGARDPRAFVVSTFGGPGRV